MGHTIGIDLGTTNSCVAVVEAGKPVIIPNDRGGRTTPSVVAFTNNGEQLVGEAAQRQYVTNSTRTISSIKRQMGTDYRKEIDGKLWSPQEISALILRKLRTDAENYLGEKVTDAVITVPAYFNDIQRQATKDAGRIAGLNVKRIINEPTSAALAYGLDNGARQKVMVYDLGGGTFDVSVIEIGDGVIEVLATAGDNHLGGDDFDERLADFLAGEIKKNSGVNIRNDFAVMQRVREAAETAKKELSASESTDIMLPYLTMGKDGPINFEYRLTRSEFNGLIRDLIDRTEGPVRQALADAQLTPSNLSKVILVGGSTRVPAVQDKVKQLTGMTPSKSINPDECVAQGAAVQGDILSDNSMVLSKNANGVLLLDVTPMSLSVETLGGVATRLIDRNASLPAHYSKIFTTAGFFQRNVEIRVLQGERPMAKDNKLIGKFRLNGIKAAAAGVPQIEVAFDLDANGILKVSARDLDTGAFQSITITDNERMSEAEIDQAIRDAEKYAENDSVRREAIELSGEASKLIQDAEMALSKHKKELPKEQVKQIKSDISTLTKALYKKKPAQMEGTDVAVIKAEMQALRNSAGGIMNDQTKSV